MHPTEMNREQRLFLINLNNRLSEIEKNLKKESLEIIKTMDKRVRDETDWINHYEIDCIVRFFLDEDHPDYPNDEDNLLAELTETVVLLRYGRSFLASENNWNDRNIPDIDNPDQLEHHCWLYHQLYDHAQLPWEDMLGIGDIWFNINLTLQHYLKLS